MSCKNVATLNASRKTLRNAISLKCWGNGEIATRCILKKSILMGLSPRGFLKGVSFVPSL